MTAASARRGILQRMRRLLLSGLVVAVALACQKEPPEARSNHQAPAPTAVEPERGRDVEYAEAREALVKALSRREVTDPKVLEAMRRVPRHEFVPPADRGRAYEDRPLPIGYDQTISQPYIVAMMTQLADVAPGERVLEIGTGSGYQAAVLAELAGEVYSVEILEPLHRRAKETLGRLGYTNIHLRLGDGYQGWPQEAPFDAIVVTAAPRTIPEPLKEQLAVGGKMVIPVGADGAQELRVLTKTEDGLEEEAVFPVRFVPMTGKAEE